MKRSQVLAVAGGSVAVIAVLLGIGFSAAGAGRPAAPPPVTSGGASVVVGKMVPLTVGQTIHVTTK